MEIIVWLALIIFFVVLEIATVGLTSIWLAGGSLAGLICAAFGMGITGQIIVFAAVSFVLLYFTRPWALKYLKPHLVKTNYEEAVGKNVCVTEQIDVRPTVAISNTTKKMINANQTIISIIFSLLS